MSIFVAAHVHITESRQDAFCEVATREKFRVNVILNDSPKCYILDLTMEWVIAQVNSAQSNKDSKSVDLSNDENVSNFLK